MRISSKAACPTVGGRAPSTTCSTGGWIYVIPFNNWPGGTNDLVSVGLSWDPRRHDPKDFKSFLAEHLRSVAEQFKDAEPVRPWIRTGRMQYSSRKSVGRRWCLSAHASGFVDAMFSRGLINSIEVMRTTLPPLLAALKDDDFDPARFAQVEVVQARLLDYSDRLVWGSYVSWRDFGLWNAWYRVWASATVLSESNLGSVMLMGKHSRHKRLEDPIFTEFEDAGFKPFFNRCFAVIKRFDSGESTVEEAREALWAEIGAYDFKIYLPDHVKGQEWALKTPGVRDKFFGSPAQHARWERHEVDP